MTATTQDELDKLYNAIKTKAFNDGLAEDMYEEDHEQEFMDKYLGGVPLKTVRALVEEHYPEEFI